MGARLRPCRSKRTRCCSAGRAFAPTGSSARHASKDGCRRRFAGAFYRNGPAVHERFGMRYQHLFDGDGMVQAFRFDGGGITHRARVVMTPKLARETQAGQRLYSGFGTPIHDRASVRRPDDVNTANISVLDHHGELLALWEAGSASILDRESLAWRGFKGVGRVPQGAAVHRTPEGRPGRDALGLRREPASAPRARALPHRPRRPGGQGEGDRCGSPSGWCTTS